MTTAKTSPIKTEPTNDAPPSTVAARQELAVGGGKPREQLPPADAADDPYANVACTD